MSEEPEFELATEVGGTVTFDGFVRKDLNVKLNKKELEKIDVKPPELVRVSVTKIPDKKKEEKDEGA